MSLLQYVVLFSVLLTFTEASKSFNKLPDTYKKGVELALQQAGFDVTYIYYNFYLKATKCKRGTENADTTKCAFRNDRPLIDCAICYKTYAGEIELEPKPYVNCVHRPALSEDMKTTRLDHCNKMGYGSGSPTLLASKS